MIKRTPQEIADFFGCYVAQDGNGYWHMFNMKPTLIKSTCVNPNVKAWYLNDHDCVRYACLYEGWVDVPSDHDWTHLYEPHPDNKSDGCYADKADSDNKPGERKEYAIVEGKRTQDLAGKVNVMLDHGWNPQGGIAVEYLPESDGYKEGSEIFYQAMVRGV